MKLNAGNAVKVFERSVKVAHNKGVVTDIFVDGKPIQDDAEFGLLLPWCEDQAEAEQARIGRERWRVERGEAIAADIVGFARSMALVQAAPFTK